MSEIGLFDAVNTAGALRRLKPNPVPEELIYSSARVPQADNATVGSMTDLLMGHSVLRTGFHRPSGARHVSGH